MITLVAEILVFFWKFIAKKIAYKYLAMIAYFSVLALVGNSLLAVFLTLIDTLVASYSISSIDTFMIFVPSNTSSCILSVLSAKLAVFIYQWQWFLIQRIYDFVNIS